MRILPDYLINENTVLLMGVYDECANLCSMAFDGEDQLLILVPPLKLINNVLLGLGSDFNGATNSTKFILGTINMPPVYIHSKPGICLMPTKSIKRQNCVWLSHSHIHQTRPIGHSKTEVTLSFGHTFVLDMREHAFNNKRQRAKHLKEQINKNSQRSVSFFIEPKKGYHISEDQKDNKYNVTKKD